MKFIVYVAVLLASAAALAIGLDRLTSPPNKVEANARQPASEAVRQIPIKRATAKENGDPNNQLSPIYPATPGKDLPVKDVAETKPPKPQPAETSGRAPAQEENTVAAAPAPTTSTAAETNRPAQSAAVNASLDEPASTSVAASNNACNVQACASTYRSFRASDCSYQPFDGPRKFCDAGFGGAEQAGASQAPVSQPAPSRRPVRDARDRDDRSLQEAIRTVRDLPPPSLRYDDDPRIVVVEPPDGPSYGLRRRWIVEQR